MTKMSKPNDGGHWLNVSVEDTIIQQSGWFIQENDIH